MSDKKALSSKCQFSVRILLPLRIFRSLFLGYYITFKRKLQETPGLTSEGRGFSLRSPSSWVSPENQSLSLKPQPSPEGASELTTPTSCMQIPRFANIFKTVDTLTQDNSPPPGLLKGFLCTKLPAMSLRPDTPLRGWASCSLEDLG